MQESGTFRYGSRVLLVTEEGNRYYLKLKEGMRFHTSEGYFECDEIVNKVSGSVVASNTGKRAIVFEPLLVEHLLSLPRRTQIIYPKDLGFIIVASSISQGSMVVEAGTGSGVLVLALANYVRPNGHVYSYDLVDESFDIILLHADRLGLREFLTLKVGDVTKKIDEKGVDVVVLDIPEPWRAVDTSRDALKPGGTFVSVVPTVNQLERTCSALRSSGFMEYVVGEVYFRPWRVKEGMTRPHHLMRSHTVYIVVARKTMCQELKDWKVKLPDGYR